jgi:hypothetical protein
MSSHASRIKSRKAALTFARDVDPDLRHRCRNPKCRCKLPEPTSIQRNAFCCRGCFTSFYRSRCLVCEQPFERKQESQLHCGKAKCRAALRRDRAHFFGTWGQTLREAEQTLEKPVNTGTKIAHKNDRPWRQVAGPTMSSATLRLATTGAERITRIESEQRALVGAYLHNPDPDRAARREAAYVAAVRRFRDHGWGKPAAAPEVMSSAGCSWTPCDHPAGEFPELPAFLCRKKESSS